MKREPPPEVRRITLWCWIIAVACLFGLLDLMTGGGR